MNQEIIRLSVSKGKKGENSSSVDWFRPDLCVFCTFEDNWFSFVRSETATAWVTLFALLFRSTCCQKKRKKKEATTITEGVRWFIPCSGSALLNLGWKPALQPATGSLIFKPKAWVGGVGGRGGVWVVIVESLLISHNYPLWSMNAFSLSFVVVVVVIWFVFLLFTRYLCNGQTQQFWVKKKKRKNT